MDDKSKGKSGNLVLRTLAQVSYIGLRTAMCVFIGVFSGRYLDSIFHTSPWLLLLFSFLGAGAAFKVIYDLSKTKPS
ncbi:MAG: AtpZ/AtpI family protein [Clostridiales bacterium]|nr:AtpZ/AtpI family protein [Clostridiales bacterium]